MRAYKVLCVKGSRLVSATVTQPHLKVTYKRGRKITSPKHQGSGLFVFKELFWAVNYAVCNTGNFEIWEIEVGDLREVWNTPATYRTRGEHEYFWECFWAGIPIDPNKLRVFEAPKYPKVIREDEKKRKIWVPIDYAAAEVTLIRKVFDNKERFGPGIDYFGGEILHNPVMDNYDPPTGTITIVRLNR